MKMYTALIFSVLAVLSLQGAAEVIDRQEYIPLIIQAAKNASNQNALIVNKKARELIPAASDKTLFEASFRIPFVSLRHYTTQFAQNRPYIPASALKIKTSQGLFYMWESETGIMCAPDPKNQNLSIEWNARQLLKVNSQEPQKPLSLTVLRLLLLINRQGEISLKRLKQA
jgi:hypothetical protein